MKFLADENYNGPIIRGLIRLKPDVDILRVQDTEMYQKPDPEVLTWAAQANRIVLSHDFQTMVGFAYERIETGHPMPGLFVSRYDLSPGIVIADLLTIIEASDTQEWADQVTFLPL